MEIYDENSYADKLAAIENAKRNIYEDSVKFDLSPLWRKWSIGGLSRPILTELGLIEISSDPRWNHMLDDDIMALYSDETGRVWAAEDFFGKIIMRLKSNDTREFENQILRQHNSLKAA